MPSGILQLLATSDKDVYLTENPTISFFEYKMFRYLNFSNDLYKLSLNETAAFNTSTSIKIPKYGHLLSKFNLHISLPPLIKTSGTYANWSDTIGYSIFSKPIELLIGGVVVDHFWPVAADMLDELNTSSNKLGHDQMIGKGDMYRSSLYNAIKTLDLMIPIDFWFTKHYSMALPLVSMTSQDIELRFSFNKFSDVINYDGPTPPYQVDIIDSNLFTEYIFLDDIILQEFQKQKHQYIIKQTVFNGNETIPEKTLIYNTKLNFINPCQEILFACVDSNNISNNNYFNYSRSIDSEPLIKQVSLLLDGKHRYDNYLPEFIFRQFFPNNTHDRIPDKHQYIMPFSLQPNAHQPTGSINLGRFDDVTISLQMNTNNPACNLYIFGIMLNVLTIENGIAKFEWMNV